MKLCKLHKLGPFFAGTVRDCMTQKIRSAHFIFCKLFSEYGALTLTTKFGELLLICNKVLVAKFAIPVMTHLEIYTVN